jgi:hypothetical protein
MQLLLASLLACTALILVLLAQPDWKTYSFPQDQAPASLPNDPGADWIATYSAEHRWFTHGTSMDRRGSGQNRVDSKISRPVDNIVTAKASTRGKDALIRFKDGNLMTESASLLESPAGHAVTVTDPNGHTIKVKFHFDGSRSFEFRLDGKKLAKVERFLKSPNVSAMIKREIRNGLVDIERSERTEARREAREEHTGSECPERSERNEDVARP